MKPERAIEILDPEHREHYESIELVNEACRMGMEALKKQIPEKPSPCTKKSNHFYICPGCNRFITKNEQSHGNIDIPYCKWCGQKLDWR